MADNLFDKITGITVTSGFKAQFKAPLDYREQVDTIEDRNKLIPEAGAWEGMKVYVKETKTTYELKGDTNEDWVAQGKDTADDLSELQAQFNLAKVKTLNSVTDASGQKFGSYIDDNIEYYDDKVFYTTTNGSGITLYAGSSQDLDEDSMKSSSYTNSAKITKTWMFIDKDDTNSNYYIYLFVYVSSTSSNTNNKILKYTYNGTTLSRSILNTISLSDWSTFNPSSFIVDYNTDNIYIPSSYKGTYLYNATLVQNNGTITLSDVSSSYANADSLSGTIIIDYLTGMNYIVNGNSIDVFDQYDDTINSFSTSEDITYSDNDHFNIFDGCYVGTTDGLSFDISVTTGNIGQLETVEYVGVPYEADELPITETGEIKTLVVKKKTLDGRIQFYLGCSNGITLKMQFDPSEPTPVVRLMYMYVDPYLKHVQKISCDPFKNTEKVLLLHSSMANQIRILSENVEVAGGTALATIHDKIKEIDDSLGDYQTKHDATTQHSTMNNRISNLEARAFKDKAYVSSTVSLDNMRGSTYFGMYVGNASSSIPSGLPIDRQPGEPVGVRVYASTYGTNGTVQEITYFQQNRTFMRVHTGSAWTPFREIGGVIHVVDLVRESASTDPSNWEVKYKGELPEFTLEDGAILYVRFPSVSDPQNLNPVDVQIKINDYDYINSSTAYSLVTDGVLYKPGNIYGFVCVQEGNNFYFDLISGQLGLILAKTKNDITSGSQNAVVTVGGLKSVLTDKLDASLKGAKNGLAELDSSGKVPSSQLPSYVDDVVEGYLSGGKFYEESAHTTQITAESDKIYVDLATNKTYRWSGSAYVEISAGVALGETSSTAYRGDRGKIAYEHSQKAHAPSNAERNVIVGIQKNGADLTPNSSTRKVNITVPTKITDLVADANAKTITLGTAVTATATKFDGTSNITIPVTELNSHYLRVKSGNRLILDGTR